MTVRGSRMARQTSCHTNVSRLSLSMFRASHRFWIIRVMRQCVRIGNILSLRSTCRRLSPRIGCKR